MTERVEQWICIRFCVKLEHAVVKQSGCFRWPQLWATDDWKLPCNKVPAHASHLVQSFGAKHQITQVTQIWALKTRFGALQLLAFPKSPLKGKRFQTVNEIQENRTGQLMTIGRTVWGPKVPTLKGTEASLSYIQCFLYLVSSSINVSIFHITWLDTFWTELFISTFFFIIAKWYPTIWIYPILLTHSSADRHLSCFYFGYYHHTWVLPGCGLSVIDIYMKVGFFMCMPGFFCSILNLWDSPML